VEIFRKQNTMISVVVLDLQMPVMGGEKAIALLKEINSDVPVILSSGFDETEAERRFRSLKPARFLQKPYTADRLFTAVLTVMNRAIGNHGL
jgi:CheY-like chemotaxis protein